MPILTGIAPDPKRPGYRLLEVDRGRFASLPAEALEGCALQVGVELSPAIFEFLHELADVEAAYRAGLRALTARGRARGDLERRLIHKQHPPQAVRQAMTRLENQGLLDDLRYAREYAARRASSGRGTARLVADLIGQGIDRRTAEAAVQVALLDEGIDPHMALRNVATRRAAQLAGLPHETRKRRLLSYLARRGHPASAVRELVEELL